MADGKASDGVVRTAGVIENHFTGVIWLAAILNTFTANHGPQFAHLPHHAYSRKD
jgi:hypothetical protein